MTAPAPVSTYRLQIREEFGFADAAAQLDYLADLGVTHLYLSPILQAAPGSAHGYDVVDHTRISEQAGGRSGFEALARAAHDRGLRIVVDVVPNHMSIPIPAHLNEPLWELLRDGRDSRYAAWFDVDWEAGADRILMPVLGESLEDVVAAGQLEVGRGGRSGDEPVLRYFEHELPLRPGTETLPLAELVEAQWWRIAHWKAADLGLNYRRFFDVKTLVAVRVEDPQVFAETHALLLELIREGLVDGLRIDHPDGLADPRGYLRMLAEASDWAWVVVEKILEGEERLPADWPVAGTTGYDALKRVGGVFVDPAGAEPLLATLAVLTGDARGAEDFALEAKMQVGLRVQAAEVARLVRLLVAICDGAEQMPDLRPETLRRAVSALLVSMDRYRAYVHLGEPLDPIAEQALREATDRARALLAASDEPTLELVRDLALGRSLGWASAEAQLARREFVIRFQQTCGPIQAKGIEDTAFYRWFHLTALNEVGGNPGEFGVLPAQLDHFAQHVLADWPATMTTLTTHDTKRSEDTRARLTPISELPVEWSVWMHEALSLSREARAECFAQLDLGTEYLLWQTLVGTWPVTAERLTPYAVKAVREACVHTSWVEGDPDYEAALGGFVDWALGSGQVAAHVEAWLERTAEHVRAATLGQKLLQLVLPGVPDVYQGTELVTRTLVDPDNRRPVDYAERARRLRELDAAGGPLGEGLDRELDLDDEKLLVTSRGLRLRREHPEWFMAGSTWQLLDATSEHAIAVVRGDADGAGCVAVATRLVEGLTADGGWGEHTVALPDGSWLDLLSGARIAAGRGGTPLAQILAHRPVALLVRAR
ncbi:MAG TPA: malto-oligosyltrehalose synthase [Dermatophilaceae bacterium]|nr:malto-oligosyltrehalose synthase [Dermatophilaceae bacterium]